MKYELTTKLSKEECIKRLESYLSEGKTEDLLRNNILYDMNVFVGKVEGDSFTLRTERPFSSSYTFAGANPFRLPRTFYGLLESDGTGTMITGINKLNRSSVFGIIVILLSVLLFGVPMVIYDPYFLVLVLAVYLVYYLLIIYKRQLAKKRGIKFQHSNLIFIEKFLDAKNTRL
jgi:hypothetical protein